jgi:hypothetical protein
MCGDLDDDNEERRLEGQLYLRFLGHARSLLTGVEVPEQGSASEITIYMEKLFCDGLSRSVRDGEEAEDGRRFERLVMQPVVFARLAGFIAGHLPPGDDSLRKVIEALMHGYGEAETMDRAHDHGHQHGDVYVHDHHH